MQQKAYLDQEIAEVQAEAALINPGWEKYIWPQAMQFHQVFVLVKVVCDVFTKSTSRCSKTELKSSKMNKINLKSKNVKYCYVLLLFLLSLNRLCVGNAQEQVEKRKEKARQIREETAALTGGARPAPETSEQKADRLARELIEVYYLRLRWYHR
jgi:hypothetical protein